MLEAENRPPLLGAMLARHPCLKWLGIALLALLVLGGLWYYRTRPMVASTQAPMAVVGKDGAIHVRRGSTLAKALKIVPVPVLKLPRHVVLPAQMMADPALAVRVFPPVTGQVAALYVQPGARVKKGAPLLAIISGDYAQARSEWLKARSALAVAQKNSLRAAEVARIGGASLKEAQQARDTMLQAQAEEERAASHVRALNAGGILTSNGLYVITAPDDGYVTDITVGQGQNITDLTVPAMTVVGLKDVWLSAAAAQDDIGLFRPGMTLAATLDGETCAGPTMGRDPVMRDNTGRMNLYIKCPNPHETFYPGAYVNADLSVPERPAVMLPKSALLMNNDQVMTYVETSPYVFVRRPLNIIYGEGNLVRVKAGVRKGERVVSVGGILLNDY
ncbi:efflux RND transporter periplasmic adaptor subunit [Formicincola oecophyllae]|uniref:Efflux RND transporter periplasmic adaptor subunit n=1 Tax=Formicincola oecophyllae TaxID=2558361 RepID=A0A4Y6UAR4_9PROT|nr:efflux RND transporter periplasmic adaptor subunit [Formicincola oecophyllae]QDH13547.1 efflux RND transporter periplasmic adaptor subunit [Formicincola oecophyllae]